MEDTKIIIEKLEQIENRLNLMESNIEEMKRDTLKMSNHISFVERVYKRIEYPFHYIMDKFQRTPIEIKENDKFLILET
jgi:hypothetical protein